MSPRGTLMLETILAVGLTGLFFSALLGFVLAANAGTDRAREYTTALWRIEEGLDALQTIAFSELANTQSGRINFANNRYSVTTNGPETFTDGATRIVKIADVFRDGGCLVAGTGTVDPDSKYLTSTSTWTDAAGRSHTTTMTTLRTRFEDPQGPCFQATQASQVTFNVAGAVFAGGKQLRQVYFTNTGGTAVTVDTITFTWNSDAEISQLFMDTTKVWSETGPGTPPGEQESGTVLNIQNFVLPAGTTAELNKGQFDEQMNGTTLTMTVTFTDGSSWTSPPFTPS